MKKIRLLTSTLLLFLVASYASAQRIIREPFKRNYLNGPTTPMADVETIGFKIYAGKIGVDKDTIKHYLKGIGGTIKGEKGNRYFSDHPITFTDQPETGDILVEIAYGAAEEIGKEVQTSRCKNTELYGDDCLNYHYIVQFKAPVAVRIVGKQGEVLDAWMLNENINLQFGNEQVYTTRKTETGGRELTLSWYYFKSEDHLKGMYDYIGHNLMRRKIYFSQLRKALKTLYPRVFWVYEKEKFKLAAAKSNKVDYSDLQSALEKSVAILSREDEQLDGLEEIITTWDQSIKEADYVDEKAKINAKVASSIHGNLAITNMYLNNFEKAKYHADHYMAFAPDPDPTNAAFTEGNQASEVFGKVYHRAKALKNNPDLISEVQHEAPELVKILGKRKNTARYDFLSTEDKYDEVYQEAIKDRQYQIAKRKELRDKAFKLLTGNNPYRARVQNSALQGNQLMMNFLLDRDLKGKPLPAQIGELTELNQLFCANTGVTSLPENIGNLENLEVLNVQNNKLQEVPESIGQLVKLQKLMLGNNQLTSLPESVKNLSSLKTLNLKGNSISKAEQQKITSWLPNCKIKF